MGRKPVISSVFSKRYRWNWMIRELWSTGPSLVHIRKRIEGELFAKVLEEIFLSPPLKHPKGDFRCRKVEAVERSVMICV
jgi:hypothetical protein